MNVNENSTKGHSKRFLKTTIFLLVILTLIYFAARYYGGLDDSLGMATYLTGILGAAVGLAGAWVAIIIAEIATRAQVQANKYDNLYYQRANSIINAAKDFIATFEFLVASAQDTRRYSFAEGSANLTVLTSACHSVQKSLEQQIMNSGLYGLLCQIEMIHSNRQSTPQLVQNVLALVGELSRTEKTTNLSDEEVQSLMCKYILATLNLNYLARLIVKIPSIDKLTYFLDGSLPIDKNDRDTCGIEITKSIREECQARNNDIIEQIKINHGITPTEESKLIGIQTKEIIDRFVAKTSPRTAREIKSNKNSGFTIDYDLEEFTGLQDRFASLRASFSLWESAPVNLNEDLRLCRTALIDFGTFRCDDYFNSLCENISAKIFPSKKTEIVIIKSLIDMKKLVSEDVYEYIDQIYDQYLLLKSEMKSYKDEKKSIGSTDNESSCAIDSIYSKKIRGIYVEMDRIVKIIVSELEAFDQNLIVFELNDDCDFYLKVRLSNYFPWSLLRWCYFPHLPSPGFDISSFFGKGILMTNKLRTPPSCFSTVRSFTPLVSTGSMFVFNIDGVDKFKKKEKYASSFLARDVVVEKGEL